MCVVTKVVKKGSAGLGPAPSTSQKSCRARQGSAVGWPASFCTTDTGMFWGTSLMAAGCAVTTPHDQRASQPVLAH